jgi:hypothetical protein
MRLVSKLCKVDESRLGQSVGLWLKAMPGKSESRIRASCSPPHLRKVLPKMSQRSRIDQVPAWALVDTTEAYIVSEQEIAVAVNDRWSL